LRTSATIVQCRAEFRLDMRLLWSLDVDTIHARCVTTEERAFATFGALIRLSGMMRRTTIRVVGNFLEISGFSRSRRAGIGAGWCRRHCLGLEGRARRSIPHLELCEFSAVQQKFRGGRLPAAAVRDMLARMTHSFLVSRRSFLAVVSTLVP